MPKPRLPRKLKIGAHVFKVESHTDKTMGETSKRHQKALAVRGAHFKYYGDLTYSDLLIRINREQTHSVKQETLVHEILHAAVEETGARRYLKSGHDEEPMVQLLAHCLVQAIRDNPTLYRFLAPEE